MKYLKTFEEINTDYNKLEFGDYVLMNTFDRGLLKFVSENIGRIEVKQYHNINVRYNTIPKGREEEFSDNC